MKITKLTEQLKEIFTQADRDLYLVGGAVRDMLLNKTPKDIDLATDALPKEILDILLKHNLPNKQIGFATVRARQDSEIIDITTYRKKETYNLIDRIPKVEFGETILEDLSRRDFTINAMAMNIETQEIIDPFNGQIDLKNERLRVPNDSAEPLKEDPLRILRATRFISKLGFRPEDRLTWDSIEYASHILYISRERWLMEMNQILLGDYIERAFEFLEDIGIINFILPEILPTIALEQPQDYHHKDVWKHTIDVIENCPKNKNLRWAALLHDLGKPRTRTIEDGVIHFYQHEVVSAKLTEYICARFRISNTDTKEIIYLVRNHLRPADYSSKWKNSTVRKLILDSGQYLANLLALSQADITSHNPNQIDKGLDTINKLMDRIDNLKKEKKLVPRLLSREKFLEILKELDIPSGIRAREIKEFFESEIANENILVDESVKFFANYLRTHSSMARIDVLYTSDLSSILSGSTTLDL